MTTRTPLKLLKTCKGPILGYFNLKDFWRSIERQKCVSLCGVYVETLKICVPNYKAPLKFLKTCKGPILGYFNLKDFWRSVERQKCVSLCGVYVET